MFDVYTRRTCPFFHTHDIAKMPTHRVLELPTNQQILGLSDFIKYDYPLPRDYGQINSQYQRTAEPIKISLVSPDDYEWRVAVENWFDSNLFLEQPFGLERFLREPKLASKRFRLHYARFLLPLPETHYRYRYEQQDSLWSKYDSPFFFAYTIGDKERQKFINENFVEVAYNYEPTSWNRDRRGITIPDDWLSNRIDENAHKYDLFA